MEEMEEQIAQVKKLLQQEREHKQKLAAAVTANENMIEELLKGIEDGKYASENEKSFRLLKQDYNTLLRTCQQYREKISNLRNDILRLELQNLWKH